jgi:hypothetical protein
MNPQSLFPTLAFLVDNLKYESRLGSLPKSASRTACRLLSKRIGIASRGRWEKVAKSELRALADALADIPFIDEEIAAHIRKQELLRETWPDLDKLLATEYLCPASRTPCLEFIVRSELLRILREGWRAHFPEHSPHSLHSLSEIQMLLFMTPTNVPAWLRTVLSKLETFPVFLDQYLSNPGAWDRGPWD